MTTAGIYGTVTEIDDDFGIVTVEVAPGTEIRLARAAVAQRARWTRSSRTRTRTRWKAPSRGRERPAPASRSGGTRGGRPRSPTSRLLGCRSSRFRRIRHPTPAGTRTIVATVTLEDVQANEELSLYIASADRVMEAMGYTEHGFRHANLVAKIAYQVLSRLGYTEREATLASVAGYLHDVGNALARDAHGQTGAVLVYQSLRDSVHGADLMPILAAIANHEETEGVAVSPISAAVILADKSDVHGAACASPAGSSSTCTIA